MLQHLIFPFIVCNFDNRPMYRMDLYVINQLLLVLLPKTIAFGTIIYDSC